MRPDAVIIIRRHLEEIAALHLPHKVHSPGPVFFLAFIGIVEKLRPDHKGIPLFRRHILPGDTVAVGLGFLGRQVVGDHKRHIGKGRHAVIIPVFAEKVHGEVFAYIDIARAVSRLRAAVSPLINLLSQVDHAVDQFIARFAAGSGIKVYSRLRHRVKLSAGFGHGAGLRGGLRLCLRGCCAAGGKQRYFLLPHHGQGQHQQ